MMSVKTFLAAMASIGIVMVSGSVQSATPTIDISDDATAIVVTVPAGCLTSMKLELAYDNGTLASSMYVRSDSAERSAWTTARTLSESVPAAGATYTVPLSELGVPADASFRLFAGSSDFALLDYVDQDAANADHDTGICDKVCHGLELGQYSKAFTKSDKKYPGILGTRKPNGFPGFSVQHNGSLHSVHFMQNASNKYTYKTLTVSASAMNTYVFTNKVYTCNGESYAPGTGASEWVTPVGSSGLNIFMGRFPEQDPGLQVQSRWFYLRLYGENDVPLLDYVPAKRKSDGVAGFYDRAAVKFVTPSGGGAFAGGNVTNNTFEVEATAVSDICSFSRLARVPAVTTLDTTDGATLTITVRPGYGIGSKLYLAHDTSDKGDEIADWTGKLEVCPSIPAAGGTYTVDLAAQELNSGRVFRAFIADRYTFLERLQQDSDDDVIDTVLSDVLCHAFELGYYSTGYSYQYASFIASDKGDVDARCGFRVCLGGHKTKIMFGQYVNGQYTYKFVSFTANECNVLKAENNALTLNGGSAVKPEAGNKSSWRTSPLGLSRLSMYMGRLPTDDATGRSCYGWWYYLKMKGIDGSLLIDYVPVKKTDGTVGFFDRVSASFITPTGGGTLVAGDAIGDETYACVAVSEAMTCDAQIPVTATWIGGTSSEFDNPANWVCKNYLGEVLPATTLPVADVTDITFGGEVAFNYTSAADRVWRNATFLDCTLADSCDWSGFGSGLALDGTINLAGHALTLAGAPTGGEITSSATGDPVALHIVIPAGVTNENVDCAITGNIRLFKEGEGMLVATKYPQTYSGGTDIVKGTLKAGVPGSIDAITKASFFGTLMTLDVRKDGTLDSGGTYYWAHHTINLHGGTLTTSLNPSLYGFNPKVCLTADSTFDAAVICDLTDSAIDLGGHTLNIDFHNGAWMKFSSRAANGRIVAAGNGVLNLNGGATLDCSTCSFDITPQFHLAFSNLIVKDLTVRGTEVHCKADKKMSVKERFTPVTQCFPNVELQDGATLDVSGYEGTWPTASSLDGCGLSFAANATVTVAVGDRRIVPLQVVSWTTPPAGADTLSVLCDNPDFRLEVREDGIYRKKIGMKIVIR